jgi:predicted nucleic acid-binding protein
VSVVACDASALVAVLLDSGADGAWAAAQLADARLAAPDLVTYETANVIRRTELAQLISADLAAQAHADLLDLAVELWPYELLVPRVWELRHNLSAYDAAYVAVAERLGATLVTLDARIAGAPGLQCAIACPGR